MTVPMEIMSSQNFTYLSIKVLKYVFIYTKKPKVYF